MDQQSVKEANNRQQSSGQNQSQMVIDSLIPPNVESPPPVFKLDTDCWDEVFDWLSVEEVHAFGRTCKAFQRVTGKYFHWKYPAFVMRIHHRETNNVKDIPDFIPFIQSVDIRGQNEPEEQFVSSYKTLKHIEFFGSTLTQSFIELLEPFLPNLETFDIYFGDVDGDIYENLLKHCMKLRSLNIYRDFHAECLPKKYPALEHLQIKTNNIRPECDELIEFFKLNPTVRYLTVDDECIRHNRRNLLESNIKLHYLIIANLFGEDNAFYATLNELHQRHFYKQLHVYVLESISVDHLAALRGLVTLYVTKNIKLPSLTTLRELGFDVDVNFDVHDIPGLCINLERLVIRKISVNQIVPFIRYSRNLTEIYVEWLKESSLDISALNKEREQLAGARKLIIYVNENVYLATRWQSREISLKLIEIQRHGSYVSKQIFGLRASLKY